METTLVPGWINDNSQTEPLRADDPRFGEVVDYLRRITGEARLRTRYEVREGVVHVAPECP